MSVWWRRRCWSPPSKPDSSAFAQGVRPGWAILKIAGTDLVPVVTKLNETYAGSTLRDLMLRRAILGRLEGHAGPVQVEFLDAADKLVTKSLAPGRAKGDRVEFGYLNPMNVWINSSRVGNGKHRLRRVQCVPGCPAADDGIRRCGAIVRNLPGLYRRSARQSRRPGRHGHGDGGLVHLAAGSEARDVVHARHHTQVRGESAAHNVLQVRSRFWWTALRRPHRKSWPKA